MDPTSPYLVLPHVNAALNATSAVLLLAGFALIRARRVAAHKACMLGAFAVSIVFLASYLTYHLNVPPRPFAGQGAIRPVYFAILITHTTLAVAVPFLAVVTLARGLRSNFTGHVRIARVTLPIWLYVSVTGVAVYALLYQLYPSPAAP